MEQEFNIDTLSGHDFEDLVARIMKKVGYKDIFLTPKSNDKGKDIIMWILNWRGFDLD